jgi:hypothetical protein
MAKVGMEHQQCARAGGLVEKPFMATSFAKRLVE